MNTVDILYMIPWTRLVFHLYLTYQFSTLSDATILLKQKIECLLYYCENEIHNITYCGRQMFASC